MLYLYVSQEATQDIKTELSFNKKGLKACFLHQKELLVQNIQNKKLKLRL